MQPRWKERTEKTHRKHLAQLATSDEPRILFLGDSMMERWLTTGSSFWKQLPANAFNAGVGGDKIENLLWRIRPTDGSPGILQAASFRGIFLMIGTNNLERDAPEAICAGVGQVLDAIFAAQKPEKVVLYGLLHRTDVDRTKIERANALLEQCARERKVEYRDFGPRVNSDDANFDDHVHLSRSGYEVWMSELLPDLA